jgi:hypothetical protein
MTPKNPAAVALGRRGGKARVQNQTPEQRIESAIRAANARWKKNDKLGELVEEITEGTKALLAKTRKRQAAMARVKKARERKKKAQL